MKFYPLLAVLCCFCSIQPLVAQQLHEFIDQHIERASPEPFAAESTDSEFLRRIYLDLIGQIPNTSETLEFLSDTATDRRSHLIDKLLEDSRYSRRMSEFFNVMLMERRGIDPDWQLFLTVANPGQFPCVP